MFLKDEGHGITEKSLDFWNKNKYSLGKVSCVEVSKEGEYTCHIHGAENSIFLSGCNCGYGGTGPNGTAKILVELGLPVEVARRAMFSDHIVWGVNMRELVLDGEIVKFVPKSATITKQTVTDWLKIQEDNAIFCPSCLSVMKPKCGLLVCEMCGDGHKVIVYDDISEQLNKEVETERAREVLQEMIERRRNREEL